MTAKLDARQTSHVHKPYIATLATLRADGSPHTAPVWYRYEDGDFLVLTDRGSQKHRNIERDPRVELCIDDRERVPFHTVIVRGTARVEEARGEAWRLALAVRYLGEERGALYVANTPAGDPVLIRIEAQRIGGW